MNTIRLTPTWIVLASLMVWIPVANAQTTVTVSDTFTGTTASNPWIPLGDACLTAATTAGTATALGACTSTVDSTADTAGSGALRLTPGGKTTNQTGGIISNSSMAFDAKQGIQVTFTTFTYGGNSYAGSYGSPSPKSGADGIGFYLLNYTSITAAKVTPALGAFGGSLGYSCAQGKTPGDGMTYGYVGLGIDEFGNFLNSGDNTNTGVYNLLTGTAGSDGNGTSPGPSVTNGTGTVGSGGSEFQPSRIGLRGYGNVNLTALQAAATAAGAITAPTNTDVQNTCSNGGTYNYSIPYTGQLTYSYTYTYNNNNGNSSYSGTLYQQNSSTKNGKTTYTFVAAGTTASGNNNTTDGYTGTGTPYGQVTTGTGNKATTNYYAITVTPTQTSPTSVSASTTFADYAAISNANLVLPTTNPIPNESATTRTAATPINYKLQITQGGLLSLWYSYNGGTYNPVITGQDISSSNGTPPTSYLFGFGASTGGGTNVHEITCFLATPANVSASSAGVNVQQAGSYRSGTQVFLAYYHPTNWWGELDAQQLMVNGTTVSINPVATWDASCVLTGGACTATGATGGSAQTARTLVTWSGTAGIPFTEGRLTSAELGWLEAGTTTGTTGATNLVDFLSGGRSNEMPASGATGTQIYRSRTSVLGDIIDSSPTWVGPPSAPYPAVWADLLYPKQIPAENPSSTATPTTYPAFATANATRLNVVYNGANDGFMHAFEAGSYSVGGTTFDSTTNDGKELFAYMPQAVLQTIHNGTQPALDFSSPNYSHNYFVDATPGTGDLFYNNTWHTWLVGGLGPGGNAIYAIDITDPTTLGVGSIIGEWGANTGTSTAPATSSTNPVTGLSAATGTNPLCNINSTTNTCTSNMASNLGQTYGTPQIRRLHDGQWGIIFGNGLNSATGHAGIYVMTITSGGAFGNVYYLDTGVGTAANPDGIAYVTPTDLDGDHITDYVYAGDVYGNVWRFDLTSATETSWGVTNYGTGATPTPLFTTPSTTVCPPPAAKGCTPVTTNQPITTALVVLSVAPNAAGTPRIMVEFGTGAVTPQTTSAAAQYSPGQQSLYGIWDWKVGIAGTPGVSYDGLTGTAAPNATITASQLQVQTTTDLSGALAGYRSVSNTPVCYVGLSCSTVNANGTTTTAAGTDYGWYMDLPDFNGVTGVGGSNQTEQVIYSPVEIEGAFVVNTTIPSNNAPTSCTTQNAQGWTMALNPATGGAFSSSFFAGGGNTVVNGIESNATGSPAVVNVYGNFYMPNQTSSGIPIVNQIFPPPDAIGGRLTWIELH